MFMRGSRSRHQRRCVRDQCLWQIRDLGTSYGARRDATDFYESECMMIQYSTSAGCSYESFSIKGMLWQGVFFVRRAVWDRVRFSTPPPSGTPRQNESRVPPPPRAMPPFWCFQNKSLTSNSVTQGRLFPLISCNWYVHLYFWTGCLVVNNYPLTTLLIMQYAILRLRVNRTHNAR